MIRSSYTPIRTTVGSLLPIESVQVIGQSDALDMLPASFLFAEPSAPQRRPIYGRYWPTLRATRPDPVLPAAGMADCPLPDDAPYPAQQPALMLYGLSSKITRSNFAEYWVEYELKIRLKHSPIIGGIALAGCPFLPYLSTREGDNLTNFGLPREIRVSWVVEGSEGFLDAEQEFTLQMPNWHSGFHYLSFGPIRATVLRLRLSTFPRLLLNGDASQLPAPPEFPGTPGFLIPFLYVFAQQESIVYQPHVPSGLLAAWQTPPADSNTYATQRAGGASVSLKSADAADHVSIVPGTRPSRYDVYSAASCLGAKRDTTSQKEFFCTNPLTKNAAVVLVIAQARQHEACIAGIRLVVPKSSTLPLNANYDELFELAVYEMDLPAGAEVLDRSPSQAMKDYRVRLASDRFAMRDAARGRSIRFIRPSNSRFFSLEFTALGGQRQVLAIETLELVQSAQVTLAPKASRRLQVRYLNFRLIGPDLATEYDKLGEGAALEVEQRAGAGRTERLFRAETLLELIERTGAKLYRNGRGWETVEETAHSESRSLGWQRRESGRRLRWEHADANASTVPSQPPQPTWSMNPTASTFRNFSNQQLRTHTEQLGYQNDPTTRSIIRHVNKIVAAASGDDDEVFVTPVSANANRLVSGFARPWHDLPPQQLDKLRTLRGIYNLNVPPHALVTNYLFMLEDLVRGGADPGRITEAFVSNILHGSALSGMTVSVGASVSAIFAGANMGYSFGQQLPAASRIVQMGDTGTIQLQATDSSYQYAQMLNRGFDDATQIRQTLDRKRDVLKSPDIMWQGSYVDILSGRLSLPITMDALGSRVHGNPDMAIVVRCLGLNSPNILADIWFDLTEEEVRDDF